MPLMKPKAPREGVFSIFSSSGVVGGRDGARGQISRHRVEAQEIQTLRLAPLRETGSKRAYKKNFRAPQTSPNRLQLTAAARVRRFFPHPIFCWRKNLGIFIFSRSLVLVRCKCKFIFYRYLRHEKSENGAQICKCGLCRHLPVQNTDAVYV